jgi:hypothetical protein
MRRPFTIIAGCLCLAGCLTDQDPPPQPQPAAAAETFDCSGGIPDNLMTVASHDEMVDRFGKPGSEAARPAGGVISSYSKIDLTKLKGCQPPAPGTKVPAAHYQTVQFQFDADGHLVSANRNGPPRVR